MQKTLLSLAVTTFVAASVSAQCVAPTSFQTTATFDGNTFFGTPALDPGACAYFDLDVKGGVTITQLGLNFLNGGEGPFNLGATNPAYFTPNLVGTTARVEMWVVDITGGINGGTVTANIPQTYSITNGTNPNAPWTLAAASNFTVAAADSPSLTTGFSVHLNPGSYGVCLVTVPNGTTLGATAPATSMLHPLFANVGLGSPLLTKEDQVFKFVGRGVRSLGFGASPAGQFMPNISMQYALDANSAYWTSYGVGCYDQKKSFYQSHNGPANPAGAAPPITIAAPHVTMIPLGSPVNQYLVQAGGAAYPIVTPGSTTHYDTLAPVGTTATHVNNLNPAVSLFGGWDDSTSVLYPLPFPLQHPGGTATSISICSNGTVFLNSTAGTLQWFDQYTAMMNGPAQFAAGFGDLWPADNVTFTGGTGEIWADSDGSSFVAVTWQNCQEFPNTANATFGNSYQIVFNSSGVVDYVWGNLKNSDAAPMVIGYTPGNGSPDPGAGQPAPRAAPNLVSAIVPTGYLSGNGDIPPILAASVRPQVGAALSMVTTNLDPTAVAGLTFISSGSLPGIDLGGIGAPGCNLNIVFPQIMDSLGFASGGAITIPFGTVPGTVAGLDFYAQTGVLTVRSPAFNALNVLVSQGVCLHVDVN